MVILKHHSKQSNAIVYLSPEAADCSPEKERACFFNISFIILL